MIELPDNKLKINLRISLVEIVLITDCVFYNLQIYYSKKDILELINSPIP